METRDGFEERLADQFGDMEEVEPLVYKQITDFIRAEKKLSVEGEKQAWIRRERCSNCGEECLDNDLSDMCSKCFEEG